MQLRMTRWLTFLLGLLAASAFAYAPAPKVVFTQGVGNGNVSALVDATDGTVKASYDYGPFGELVRADGLMAKANPFRFSTKYQDDESDFLYYGYRYLANGRWLNRDPIEESGGLNLYAFVGNDGVNGVDPLGQWNYWNPATYGVNNGVGWSTLDSFNPFHESASWDGYSWDYFGNSAQATLDGIIPFADPFLENGGYDPCDKWLALSRHLGQLSRDAYLMRAASGLSAWGAAGTGPWRATAGVLGDGYFASLAAASIGTGAGKLSAGDNWGALDLGLGLLGIKPSVSGTFSSAKTFASETGALLKSSRVGTSELGNALANLGRTPLGRNLHTLDEFGPGSGFSGVYDVASGKFLAYPSGATVLKTGEAPVNLVLQTGGHKPVNDVLSSLLGNTSNNRLGFSMVMDGAGDLKVGWNSMTINGANPNILSRTVPVNMRQPVLNAIMAVTGRKAY